jgi:hypothetical protein
MNRSILVARAALLRLPPILKQPPSERNTPMNIKSLMSAFVLATLWTGPAFAADRHDHADHKPIHGGVVVEAGHLDLELVARPESLTLYLADGDKAVSSAGARASATVYAGGDKTPVTFESAGDNRLVARGSFKTGVGVRVAVVVALPGQPEAKANFKLK